MSGIFGLLNLDGRPVERNDLQPMLAAMQQRGPDGSGLWIDGSVGLGHAMLWTTPESLFERPPVANRRGDLVTTADVRLDNRDELIDALDLNGRPAAEIGDQELILSAYEKWGTECPNRLLGAFAFAIWDARQQILFCARDHFGVKPFVYHHQPGRLFAFGSQAKAILAAERVPLRINEARIADYLVTSLEGIDKTSTFYQELYRFPPAHGMVVEPGGITSQRYWSLDPPVEIRYSSDEQYVAAFRALFDEAVRCRLRVHGPAASMLSGGMDSSSIVAVAREMATENGQAPLHTFSARSDNETGCVESRSINAVLAQGGVIAHIVSPAQLNSHLADFDFVVKNSDDPFDQLINHVPLTMYSAARQNGVRVLLDGVGGDLVVSLGPWYLAHILNEDGWNHFLREVGGYQRSLEYMGFAKAWKSTFQESLLPIAVASLPRFRRLYRRLHPLDLAARDTKGNIIRSDFADAVNLESRLWALEDYDRSGNLFERQIATFKHPYLAAALERYNRVASALNVEPRHPFVDKRLVEFCLALPRHHRVRDGWSKILPRMAMQGLLPEEVVWRTEDTHLGPELRLSYYEKSGFLIEAALNQHLVDIEPFVDIGLVHEARRNFISDGRLEDGDNVWDAVSLALWYNQVVNTSR